jgi:hypothetical protein
MTELTTTLTDYAISLTAFIFAGVLLHRSWVQQQISISLWAFAFGFVALAAGLGGTCHGFVAILGPTLTQRFWIGMIYALTLASLALVWGTVTSTLASPCQPWGLVAALTKASLLWLMLQIQPLTFPSFTLAAWDYGLALGIALLLYGGVALTQNQPLGTQAARWMVAGILTSGLAIGLLASQLSFKALPPATLYHLVQLIGLGLLFQGAKRLRDR